jgi:hypothetical protein
MKLPYLIGNAIIKSDLSIEDVGEIISNKMFGGLKFGGKELNIHEEIPAIFIQNDILGLQIVLDGYPGLNEDDGYSLSISPGSNFPQGDTDNINMDDFLRELLKITLVDSKKIIVV